MSRISVSYDPKRNRYAIQHAGETKTDLKRSKLERYLKTYPRGTPIDFGNGIPSNVQSQMTGMLRHGYRDRYRFIESETERPGGVKQRKKSPKRRRYQ